MAIDGNPFQKDAKPDVPLARAAHILRQGGLVAMPTETVYGLAANAENEHAVAKIFAAKGRPSYNPLILHVANLEMAKKYGHFSSSAIKLAQAFWPGGLTLVVPLKKDTALSSLVTAGLDTIALRVPKHPLAQQLITLCGFPLAAPSANRSGHVSPTRAEHVRDDLGTRVDLVLENEGADFCAEIGIESTIIGPDLIGPGLEDTSSALYMLRAGAVPREAIEEVLGYNLESSHSNAKNHAAATPQLNAPGQLESHYAPKAPLQLNVSSVQAGEALLAFGPPLHTSSGAVFNLSEKGDLDEAASLLFAALRQLDAFAPKAIAVMPIPAHGIGEAINDRLKRAAAPRPNAPNTLSTD